MDMIFSEIKQKNNLPQTQQPFFLSQSQFPPPPNLNHNNGFDLDSKISSSLLLIIIILAIIFFISGLLHLLVRYLLIPPNVAPDDSDSVTVLQGQLQQLFHLHDSGVDQSFIDTLPVFNFKNIMGSKNPFDCAVCLCEFECEDKLRLLPKCSHAFHMVCIDTWLLSHSTCPLCRASLLPDFNGGFSFSPVVSLLESGSQSFSESRNSDFGAVNSNPKSNPQLGVCKNDELGDFTRKSCENPPLNEDENLGTLMGFGEKVVNVKLGKFKNVSGNGEASCCDTNADARRCFSMGSFEYVMDNKSTLQVSIKPPVKKQQSNKKTYLPLTPGHRQAMSECGFETRRDQSNGFDSFRCIDIQESNSDRFSSYGVHGSEIGRSKRGSFSVSEYPSRRAFSFRFPPGKQDDFKIKNVGGCKSEIGMARWENGGSELGSCDENGIAKTPSFARRTLLWLVGKQNKVVHSSFTGPDHG